MDFDTFDTDELAVEIVIAAENMKFINSYLVFYFFYTYAVRGKKQTVNIGFTTVLYIYYFVIIAFQNYIMWIYGKKYMEMELMKL